MVFLCIIMTFTVPIVANIHTWPDPSFDSIQHTLKSKPFFDDGNSCLKHTTLDHELLSQAHIYKYKYIFPAVKCNCKINSSHHIALIASWVYNKGNFIHLVWKKGTSVQQNCCKVSDYQLGPALKKNPYMCHILLHIYGFFFRWTFNYSNKNSP